MRIRTLVMTLAGAGISAWSEQPAVPATEYSVAVCMDVGHHTLIRGTAQREASKIFAEIGIRIDWRLGSHDCDSVEGIFVSLSDETPATKYPGAWAYARPYEGIHIEVFYDRMQKKMGNAGAPRLLAYVLAHEITHILQGINRHSETGIMKAHWDSGDYFDMRSARMKFTSTDIGLIRLGLEARKTRSAVSKQRPAILQSHQ